MSEDTKTIISKVLNLDESGLRDLTQQLLTLLHALRAKSDKK